MASSVMNSSVQGAGNEQHASLAGLVESSSFIEFRYCPARILKLEVEKARRKYFHLTVLLTALILTVVFGVWDNNWSFALYCGLVGVLIPVGLLAYCWSHEYSRLAGLVSITPTGIGFSGNYCYCNWRDLISADPLRVAEPGGLKLIFNSSAGDFARRAAGEEEIMERRMPNERSQIEIDLDFRAVSEKDRGRVLWALRQFVPENRLHHTFRENSSTCSFTQLWLNSLGQGRASTFRLDAGTFLEDGRYEIVRMIASGGQATAYAAIDHLARIDKGEPSEVVLKEFVLPIHAGERNVQEMLLEIESLARLMERVASDQVVRFYRVFTKDFRSYVVLEHVPGSSLRDLISAGQSFSKSQLIEFGKQMSEMLIHLHQQTPPVIHRDFSPDNLLLMPNGRLKLIDFDVAVHDELAGPSKVVGKPSYMAPEQFRGQPCCQSDVYSLGACLHFLITGQNPTPISISNPMTLVPDVCPDLDAIVAACTQLILFNRIASAKDVAKLLEGVSP